MPDNGTRIPKLTPSGPQGARKVETLPLSSIDGYVMSRIDGATTERDLAASTGLTEDTINDTLGKLEFLGLIEYAAVTPAAASRAARPAPTPPQTSQARTGTGSAPPRRPPA